MLTTILLVAVLATEPEFDVQTLDGRSASGRIVVLDDAQIKLETADGPQAYELATLASVTSVLSPSAGSVKPSALVELVDGSQLPASEYLASGKNVRLKTTAGAPIDANTRIVRWVRFAHADGADEKIDRQWAEMVDAKAAGDVLVIRKQGALDEAEGELRDVSDETVQFEVDKELVAVKRAKVEGFIYFHPPAENVVDPIGQLATGDGSKLAVRTAALRGNALVVKTPTGLSLPLPLDTIVRLDYSTGKIAYLSDLEPQAASYTLLFGPKEELPALSEYYRFRRDQGFEGKPLVTSGQTYRKGLALASRTTVAYRLQGKFRIFKATAGIDDGVRPLGNVRLIVQGDGKVLWQGDVRGSEPAQELEVEIGGVKRLEIVADYGDDQDIGDRLNLCEARVSK